MPFNLETIRLDYGLGLACTTKDVRMVTEETDQFDERSKNS